MTRGYDLDGRVASLTMGPSTATYPDLSQFGPNAFPSAYWAAPDLAGNVATQTDARSVITTYTYDVPKRFLTSNSDQDEHQTVRKVSPEEADRGHVAHAATSPRGHRSALSGVPQETPGCGCL